MLDGAAVFHLVASLEHKRAGLQERKEHGLSGQKEVAVAVMVLGEVVGNAGEAVGDRKVRPQEGQPGDGWASRLFLAEDVFFIPEHLDQTQSDEQADQRGI